MLLSEVQELTLTSSWRNPNMSERFDPSARIVQHPFFNFGISKFQNEHNEALTTMKNSKLVELILSKDGGSSHTREASAIVKRAARKLRASYSLNASSYLFTRSFLSISSNFECFLSVSGFLMNKRRKGPLPRNFATRFFLAVNRVYWGIYDVQKIVREWNHEFWRTLRAIKSTVFFVQDQNCHKLLELFSMQGNVSCLQQLLIPQNL